MLNVDSINDLPIELKVKIFSHSQEVWVLFALHDDNLYNYTRENTAQFVDLFTVYNQDDNGPGDYILISCIQTWKLFNKLHRCNNFPAVICRSFQKWYINGKLHREYDQPAVIFFYDHSCISKSLWFKHGLLHRDTYIDGRLLPAVINHYADEYWINGVNVGLTNYIYNLCLDIVNWLGY